MNRFDWMRKTADELGYEINSLRRWADRPGFPLMGTAAEVKKWHSRNIQQNGPPSKAERAAMNQRDRDMARSRRVMQLHEQEGLAINLFHKDIEQALDAGREAMIQAGDDEAKRHDLQIYFAEAAYLLLCKCHPNYKGSLPSSMRVFWGDLLDWVRDNAARLEEENELGIEHPRHAEHPSYRYDAIVAAEFDEPPADETEPG